MAKMFACILGVIILACMVVVAVYIPIYIRKNDKEMAEMRVREEGKEGQECKGDSNGDSDSDGDGDECDSDGNDDIIGGVRCAGGVAGADIDSDGGGYDIMDSNNSGKYWCRDAARRMISRVVEV
ncbi:Protein of unknown function [Pyronema omphalodes CBS 100304]|uniref:Uncharacterized protein n=1 Tax=Pyronema omphalodes (strain CBS 100304) TaxID=1076935 RepID=U4LD04_PYROM|nr:Protein of unknown function [Pyronema omphalodes CBS 100304]